VLGGSVELGSDVTFEDAGVLVEFKEVDALEEAVLLTVRLSVIVTLEVIGIEGEVVVEKIVVVTVFTELLAVAQKFLRAFVTRI